MINTINFIRPIPIELPLKMILTRLGYRCSKTVLSPAQRERLNEAIAEGFSLCLAAGCWRRIAITGKNSETIVLQDGSVLKSSSLAALLSKSSDVVFMATTVGPAIVHATSDAITRGDGATAVIYDAVGGQCADASMNWINEFVRRPLNRRAEQLTAHRFSPGFGDFGLENQKIFYSLLNLERLDIELTSRYMLIPEKSVTAVAGIEKM